ncbi:MAG: TldD/PmbA family protein [Pseudomonadota bacterium]
MSETLQQLSEHTLERALKAGADQADVLAVNGIAEEVDVLGEKLEKIERSEGRDIGLRVIVGARQACVSVSDSSERAINDMVERALAMAKAAPDDPNCHLAEPDQLSATRDADALDLYDDSQVPTTDALKENALEAEAAALAVDDVTKTQGASASYSTTEIFMAASNGFRGGYKRSGFSTSCVAIAGNGLEMERDWAGEMRVFQDDLPAAEEIGTLAGKRAVERFGANRAPMGSYPVLFDERISSTLIGHLLSAINGASITRGSSWLKEDLGQKILPSGLDLIEDPLRPRISGSKPFDAEGLATTKRKIIDDGVLAGWTLDLSTARQLEMHSTANAGRGVSSPPSPGAGNIALTQSANSKADLMAQMGTGLLVTSLIGSTINPNTGDYSRGASGFWVENGEITYPVNEITIAANLRDMLGHMQPANDARMHLSRVIPSLLVESMIIASS